MSLREDRRSFLKNLGLLGIGSTLSSRLMADEVSAATQAGSGVCVMTPEQTEGPYYLSLENQRSDITEGKQGVALTLSLQVLDTAGCQPMAGAVVDIWHCDAEGTYSGYENSGDESSVYDGIGSRRRGRREPDSATTFLRGVQIADQQGRVNFQTIYPGCYSTRTTHIHAKIYLSERELLTTQFYFPEQVTDRIYATSPHYRSQRDTRNSDDWIMRRASAEQSAMLQLDPQGEGYIASLVIGVKRT